MRVADLKNYALDFINDDDTFSYYAKGEVPLVDVLYLRVAKYSGVEKARFVEVLKKARERVIVYIERGENKYEAYFNQTGYFWDHIGEFVYVVDKNE